MSHGKIDFQVEVQLRGDTCMTSALRGEGGFTQYYVTNTTDRLSECVTKGRWSKIPKILRTSFKYRPLGILCLFRSKKKHHPPPRKLLYAPNKAVLSHRFLGVSILDSFVKLVPPPICHKLNSIFG